MKLKDIFKSKKEKRKESIVKMIVLSLCYIVLSFILCVGSSFIYIFALSTKSSVDAKAILYVLGGFVLLIIFGFIIHLLIKKLYKKRFYYYGFIGTMPALVLGSIALLLVDVFDVLPDYMCRVSVFTVIGVYSLIIYGVASLINKIRNKK